MAHRHTLPTTQAENGSLTVFESILPNPIQRLFLIHGAGKQQRGGHRHHRMTCALVCTSGQCRVRVNDGQATREFWLEAPDQCLVLEPHEWREMDQFSADAVLLVIADCPYDPADYIYEPYPEPDALPIHHLPSALFFGLAE